MTVVRIGISGWVYPAWRGVFYPVGLPHRRELEYAGAQFSSIEINGSFYSLQRPSSYRRWRETTPAGFVFALKAPRFITHMKKLADVETPVANFLASGVLELGPKLGPLLWQLPASLAFNPQRLRAFFELLPRSTAAAAELASRHDSTVGPDRTVIAVDSDRPLRHALEPRHQSFATPEATELCRRHHVALVVADSAGRWPSIEDASQDFVYVRLHGADELYVSGYTNDSLDHWARKIRAWRGEGRDVYVYFDNDAKVHSPADARRLMHRLGLLPSVDAE